MTEFDGYLWAVYSDAPVFRSPDQGATWEFLPTRSYGSIRDFGRVHDWAELGDKLYIAGIGGFGRWNETELTWEHLSRGLPDEPYMKHLAINRDRIFAAVGRWGVWLFDQRSETWIPAGLQGIYVTSLVSHQSDLYAATKEGIYRASILTVQPYGKAATTWGALKRQ